VGIEAIQLGNDLILCCPAAHVFGEVDLDLSGRFPRPVRLAQTSDDFLTRLGVPSPWQRKNPGCEGYNVARHSGIVPFRQSKRQPLS